MKYSLPYAIVIVICLVIFLSAHQQSNHFDIEQLFNNQPAVDLFSPNDNIRNALVDFIGKEKKHIKIAMYYLADTVILKALQEAIQKRNIIVDIIVDPTCPARGIESIHRDAHVHIYNIKSGIMHHKFILFCGLKVLGEGSYNFTYSAQNKNRENFSFYHGKKKNEFCHQKYLHFSKRFDYLLQSCSDFEPGRLIGKEAHC